MSAEQKNEAGALNSRLDRRTLFKTAGAFAAGLALDREPISASQDTSDQNPQSPADNKQNSLENLYSLSQDELLQEGWEIYFGMITPIKTYKRQEWQSLLYKSRSGEHSDRFQNKEGIADNVTTIVQLDVSPVDKSHTSQNPNQRLWECALSEADSLPPNMNANITAINLPDADETFAALVTTPLDSFTQSPMEIYQLPSTAIPSVYHSLMFEREDLTCFMRATIPQGMEQDFEYLKHVAGLTEINPDWREPENLF